MNSYCYHCSTTLPAGAKTCSVCHGPAMLAPGEKLVDGPRIYTIDSLIGIGGMGTVYKAVNQAGKVCVVKELIPHADPAKQAENLSWFMREAQLQATLAVPSPFPAGFGYFEFNKRHFMAMEFIPGDDLEKVRESTSGKKLDPNRVLQIGIAVCDALTILHNQTTQTGQINTIVHRDIKPANIIQEPNGTIRVLDLGLARPVFQANAPQAKLTQIGTFEYSSPEQVAGAPTPKSDLYSLGMALFELVVGRLPRGDYNERLKDVDRLPNGWQATFRQVLRPNQNLRHRDAEEFKQALINLLPDALKPQPPRKVTPIFPIAPPPPLPTALPPAPAAVAALPQRTAAPLVASPALPAIKPIPGAVYIDWRQSVCSMINPHEYRQPETGRVMRQAAGVQGIDIVPYPLDIGPGAGTGAAGITVTSDTQGNFSLDETDVTVPVKVTRREILLVFLEGTVEVHRETVIIHRPPGATATKVVGQVAAPFKAAARAIRPSKTPTPAKATASPASAKAPGGVVRKPTAKIANRVSNTGSWFIAICMLIAALGGTAFGIVMQSPVIWLLFPALTLFAVPLTGISRAFRNAIALLWAVAYLMFLMFYFLGRT